MNNTSDKQFSQRIGRGMTIAAWVIALLLLSWFFNHLLEKQRNPNQAVYSRVDDDGNLEVVLKRNRYGHYITKGEINGHSVEFLLDTGASDVAIPGKLAKQLGLAQGSPVQYRTANGLVTAYRTTLDKLSIGLLEIRGVPASINPAMHDMEVLLGMSVLKHVEFTQRGDTLILRPYE
jgi:aspartyl protease family protein